MMVGTDAAGGEEHERLARTLYLCDLRPGFEEWELRQLLENYGELAALEQVDCACEEAVAAEFRSLEAAEEARSMLHLGVVRGRTVRCLPLTALEAMRGTMDGGQRLFLDRLDPRVEVRGLHAVCELFGRVLDCKVELGSGLVDDEAPRGLGFVHFARPEDAAKALEFLPCARLGGSTPEVRRWAATDVSRLSGCRYPWSLLDAAVAWKEQRHKAEGTALAAPLRSARLSPQERKQACLDHFRSLNFHHAEVADDVKAKLARLPALVELYETNQDRQMIVVAETSCADDVMRSLKGVFEAVDLDVLSAGCDASKRRDIASNWEAGNIFVLVMDLESALCPDTVLERPPAVLVNFDLPRSLEVLLYQLRLLSEPDTKVHNLVAPSSDVALGMPLMATMEEVGHEVPAQMVELLHAAEQCANED